MNAWEILILYLIFKIAKGEEEFLFVYEHCRHGTRMPIFSNSTFIDEFNSSWTGNGELTAVGHRMHYILGIRNRKRYSSFLSPVFNEQEILIFSTDKNRTISSIQAQLMGMYPPGTGKTLTEAELKCSFPPISLSSEVKEEINELGNDMLIDKMQIIPFHLFDNSKNYLFLNEPFKCPPMEEIMQNLMDLNSGKLIELFDKGKEKYGEGLKKFFGFDSMDFMYNYSVIITITENFMSNYKNGRDLSRFKEITQINLDEFYDYAVELEMMFLYKLQFDNETALMAASPMMRDILAYMEKRIDFDRRGKTRDLDYSAPKMVIHSGHDTTLTLIQYFMSQSFGVNVAYTPFGSSCYFELIKKGGKYLVYYLVNDETRLSVDFQEFSDRTREFLWSQEKIDNFCSANQPFTFLESILILVSAILSFLTIFLTVKIVNLNNKIKKKVLSERSSLITE